MSTILPFRGIRYNPEAAPNLADVVTPPYDVIGASAQEQYYQKHPFNIIRLEYGRTFNSDDECTNRYTRAAAEYASWLQKKVLRPDEKPALYLYEQEFSVEGVRRIRSGYICAVKLEPYEKGVVLPHEETLPKHKADRLSLMRACRTNFSPIFSLYSDPESSIANALRETATGAPEVTFTDESGECHRLWPVTDPGTISQVQKLMSDKKIFIADGHHRYETALTYKLEREKENPRTLDSNPTYDYVMMTLVNLYDPGLVVLPTHRLVKNVSGSAVSGLLNKLSENFTLDEFEPGKSTKNINKMLRSLAEAGKSADNILHRHVFGIYLNKKLFIATLRDEKVLPALMPPGKSPAWQGLDVSVLHSLIIEKYLGIGEELRARGDHITYSREDVDALRAVDSGEYQIAFFLNPTLVEEVTAVAANGEKMPQKSTFFYPKLITGLVIKSLE